jgi:hypothetical protein
LAADEATLADQAVAIAAHCVELEERESSIAVREEATTATASASPATSAKATSFDDKVAGDQAAIITAAGGESDMNIDDIDVLATRLRAAHERAASLQMMLCESRGALKRAHTTLSSLSAEATATPTSSAGAATGDGGAEMIDNNNDVATAAESMTSAAVKATNAAAAAVAEAEELAESTVDLAQRLAADAAAASTTLSASLATHATLLTTLQRRDNDVTEAKQRIAELEKALTAAEAAATAAAAAHDAEIRRIDSAHTGAAETAIAAAAAAAADNDARCAALTTEMTMLKVSLVTLNETVETQTAAAADAAALIDVYDMERCT